MLNKKQKISPKEIKINKMKYTSILDFKKSKAPSKTSIKVKKVDGGGEEPKKVDKAPAGFAVFKKEGNKTYYKKVTTKMPAKLQPAPKATPGGKSVPPPNDTDYFNKMVELVKAGHSPDELVKNKYIDPSFSLKLQPYFKPQTTEEIVYTEELTPTQPTPPKPKPITAYDTEHMFGPGGKAIGAVMLNTRDSKDFAAQQGEVSPTGQDIWFAFYKPNSTEVDENKGLFKIPRGVFENKIAKGTTTINDPAMLSELQKYKYTPKKETEKMATEIKEELPFQATGATGVSPRLRQ